eukprot:s475_g29.t2
MTLDNTTQANGKALQQAPKVIVCQIVQKLRVPVRSERLAGLPQQDGPLSIAPGETRRTSQNKRRRNSGDGSAWLKANGLHSGLQSIKPMEIDHFQSDANESHFNEAEDFRRLYAFLLFTAALWISGKLFARLGMPALVGEILVGILAGPHAKNWVPETDALILQGELALVLLMIEAGLHVDMEMIKIVGLRALAVGVIGSFLPMGLGMAVATLILKLDAMESFAIGASFATMSTGIALNVMKAGGVLNQPSGQLLLAAATVNELINISLITEIDAVVANGPWQTFVFPIVIMLLLVVFMSFLAVKVVPCFLDKVVLPRVAPKNQENVVLGMLLATTVVYMPACKLTGSSALLGAFLAGFCFCTDEHVHHTWKRQVKRVATFLMRYFFACSIGFTVPVEDFQNIEVWKRASILLLCIVGKICMGFFAMPLTLNEFLSLGFAWGSWGEFSFILAVRALRGNLLSGKNYSALVLAVLISILICPTALRFVLSRSAIEAKRKDTAWGETGVVHPVYYCVQTRSHALWGQQGALLNMLVEVGCKIVDFRSFHPFSDVGTQHVINELYLKDTQLQLVLAEQLEPADQERLNLRTKEILRAVLAALRSAEVKISSCLTAPKFVARKDRHEMESLRADLLEAQQSEAEARAALQQSAEYGKLLLSRNEALEQELEVLRQEQSRKVAAEVSQRSRLEEECRRLEQELETKSKPQERHGYSRTSRLLSLSGSVDSDEEPNLAQMQQRLKRCEKSEQEHREAAWLAEEHANMLEEQNQKLEEECRRLQAQLTRSRPNDEVVQRWQKAGSLVRDSLRDEEAEEKLSEGRVGHVNSNAGSAPTSPSSWSPFRRRTARLSASEDLEQLVSTVSSERDAALAEKAASEARCEARLREMDEEITALRLLLEEETARTDTMAQHIDYLGSMLEERHAVNGAAVMLKSLGLSRPGSPERDGELLSAALAFKGRPTDEGSSAKLRRPRDSSVASHEEVPSLQSFLADLRSRSPSMSRKRSRAPHCTLEDFLGEKPTSLANVTASTRAVASLSPSDTDTAKKVSLLELLGWSRCSHCGSLMWFSNGQSNGSNGHLNGRNQNNVNAAAKNGKKNLAKSWTLALSQDIRFSC